MSKYAWKERAKGFECPGCRELIQYATTRSPDAAFVYITHPDKPYDRTLNIPIALLDDPTGDVLGTIEPWIEEIHPELVEI